MGTIGKQGSYLANGKMRDGEEPHAANVGKKQLKNGAQAAHMVEAHKKIRSHGEDMGRSLKHKGRQ